MALTFIGKSPDPLPIPPGLVLESRRFASLSSVPACQRPPCPSKLTVRYTVTRPDGRLKPETAEVLLECQIEDAARCTVHMFIALLHEHGPLPLQLLSARHPIELRYRGEMLAPEKLLSDYALKDNSELQIVIKPRKQECEVRGAIADSAVTRLRFNSHKLTTPLALDGLTSETTVGDLKLRLQQLLAANPIHLVRGPTPPVPAPPPTVVTLPDGETTTEVRVGDQFTKPEGGGGGGGGKKDKGGGGVLQRASDRKLIEQAQLPELWPLTLNDPEDKLFSLLHQGAVLPDEALLSACKLLNNEMLYLNFKAPWEPDEPIPKPGEGKKGGKKKK